MPVHRPRPRRGSRVRAVRPCRRRRAPRRRCRSAVRSRNRAPPISSANTPPGPNATSGPKSGSCTMPASSSVPPRIIGCTRTGPPIRSAAARTSSSVSRFKRDAAALGLVHACGCRLEHDRVSQGARCVDRFVGAGDDQLRDDRDPVGRQECARVALPRARGRRTPRAQRRPGSVRRPRRCRRVSGPCPRDGAAIPRGRLRRRAREPPTRDSANVATGEPASRRLSGVPSALTITASTGFSEGSLLQRFADRRRDLVGAGDDGRDEEHDHRVDAGIAEDERQCLRVAVAGRRAEQVDGIRGARFARQHGGERLPGLGRELRHARDRRRRTRRRRGSRARLRSSARRRAGRAGAAGSRAAWRRRRAPRGCARAGRRRCGRALRPRRRSPRARRCASLLRARRRADVPAFRARIGLRRARRAATCANFCGLPKDSR